MSSSSTYPVRTGTVPVQRRRSADTTGSHPVATLYTSHTTSEREAQQQTPSWPSRVRDWWTASRETRRINRAYCRQRRQFERALDQVQDPSAQQELYAMWATRS